MVEGDGEKGKRRPGLLLGWSANRDWRSEPSESEKSHTIQENRLRNKNLSLV